MLGDIRPKQIMHVLATNMASEDLMSFSIRPKGPRYSLKISYRYWEMTFFGLNGLGCIEKNTHPKF